MQQVTAEVQHVISRAGRADFDDVEDSLEIMADMNVERQQLAHLMTNNDEDDEDFIAELNLSFPADDTNVPPVAAKTKTTEIPSPPSYLLSDQKEEPAPAAPAVQPSATIPTSASF